MYTCTCKFVLWKFKFVVCLPQLLESEMVSINSESRCGEQGIPFFRFSPNLDEVIAAGETDNSKLFSMILQTKVDLRSPKLTKLTDLFHKIAEASHVPMCSSIPEEDFVEEEEENLSPSQMSSPAHLPASPPQLVVSISEHDAENVPFLSGEECVRPYTERRSSLIPHESTNKNLRNTLPPGIDESILSDIQEESFHSACNSSTSQVSSATASGSPRLPKHNLNHVQKNREAASTENHAGK